MQRKTALFLPVLCVGVAALLLAQSRGPERERAARLAARGLRGAVAAGSEGSAEAAMRIMHRGGNAVDAGVAAMFAAAVCEYSHFGLGGEAPILIRTKEGKVISLAGVGTMPKAASAEMFRRRPLERGEVMSDEPGGLKGVIPVAGLMPALVPGMLEAGMVALRDYGTLSFADVIAPAIDITDGHPLDETRASSIYFARRFFSLWPTTKAHFMPDGQQPVPGMVFRQPNTARTLRALVEAEAKARASGASRTAGIDAARDHFYRGDIARRIDAFVKQHGGLLGYNDMANFRVKAEEAVCADYRGYQVCKPGFWTQGPVMLQALNLLSGYNLTALGHNSAEYIHRVVEALKLAYADRDTWYGDPKFADVPAGRLLSREYADERRGLISQHASMEFRPGDVKGRTTRHPSSAETEHVRIDDALMARDTTGVNVVDKDGVMFSATPSGAWMPSVMAGDTGIPLTQRAQSFLLIKGHPNELAPGKRPRVTLSPTLVLRGGKPAMALSTPGGDNQDQALLQVLLNVVEFGMNAERAIEAPRVQTRHLVSSFDNHAMNPGELYVDERIPNQVFGELTQRGHKAEQKSRWNSGSHPVLIRVLPNGVIEAGADPWGYRVAQAW